MPYCRANFDLVYVSFDDSFFCVCLDAFYGFRKRFSSKASAFHAVKKRSNDLCFQIGSLERVCVLLMGFFAVTCASYVCSAPGATLKASAATIACPSGVCTDADCCDSQFATFCFVVSFLFPFTCLDVRASYPCFVGLAANQPCPIGGCIKQTQNRRQASNSKQCTPNSWEADHPSSPRYVPTNSIMAVAIVQCFCSAGKITFSRLHFLFQNCQDGVWEMFNVCNFL